MSRLQNFWKEWRGFVLLILVLLTFRSAIADWYEVPTGSMKPTIIEGDRIFVNKLAYDIKIPFTLVNIASWSAPQRGDIVVFDSPVEEKRLVKRVVGLPGDVIAMVNNQLHINGKPAHYDKTDQAPVKKYWPENEAHPLLVDESINGRHHVISILPQYHTMAQNYGPVAVPRDHYFMLGDNRDNSADSRYIGPVHRKYILGKAKGVAFSFSQFHRSFSSLQ